MDYYNDVFKNFFGGALMVAEAIAAGDKAKQAKALARETAESIIRRGYRDCTVIIDGQSYSISGGIPEPQIHEHHAPRNETECKFSFLHLYKYAHALNGRKVEGKIGDNWSFTLNGAISALVIRYNNKPIAGVQFLDRDKDEIIGAFYSDKYDKVEKVRIYQPDLIGYPTGAPLLTSADTRIDEISWKGVIGAHGEDVLRAINKMLTHVYRK